MAPSHPRFVSPIRLSITNAPEKTEQRTKKKWNKESISLSGNWYLIHLLGASTYDIHKILGIFALPGPSLSAKPNPVCLQIYLATPLRCKCRIWEPAPPCRPIWWCTDKLTFRQSFSRALNRECSQVRMVDTISQPGCAECGAQRPYKPDLFILTGGSQYNNLPWQRNQFLA